METTETYTIVTPHGIIVYTCGDYPQVERHIACRTGVDAAVVYGRGKSALIEGEPDLDNYANSLFWLGFDALESAS